MRDTSEAIPRLARYARADANSACVRWKPSSLRFCNAFTASSKCSQMSARCGRDRSGVTSSVRKEAPPPIPYPIRRRAPLSQRIKLSRTSIRPEKAQSNRRLRSASIVRASEIQSREKGLYFFNRLKCLAQGTRTGINSSTSRCPPRKEARAGLTRRAIRAEGKLRRRFLRKGTRIARSPKFQYSTTRMLEGGSAGFFRGGRGGIRSFRNRATDSKIRTSRHLPGVMGNNLARVEGSLKLGRFVPRT